MAELIEGGARDHVAKVRDRRVPANAACLLAYSKPQSLAGLLHLRSKTAIIDDLAANRFESFSLLQDLRANQNASTCGPCDSAARICDSRRWIQKKKEVDKRW